MISWTISAPVILTAFSSNELVASNTHYRSTSDAPTFYTDGRNFSGESKSSEASTIIVFSSYGSNGGYTLNSTSALYFTSSTSKGDGPDGTSGSSYSLSNSYTNTQQTVEALPTAFIATSTVLTSSSVFTTKTTRSSTTRAYSTSGTDMQFVSSSVSCTVVGSTNSTREASQQISTTLTETQHCPATATVYQADASEILYQFDPNVSWPGYAPVTSYAATQTRLTVSPSSSTVEMAKSSVSRPTSGATNESQSFSLSWRALSPTPNSITVTRPVVVSELPNSTATFTQQEQFTQATETTGIHFSSNSFTHGSFVSTYAITSWATIPAKVRRWTGSVEYDATVSSYVSTTRQSSSSILSTVASTSSTTGRPVFRPETASQYVSRTIQRSSNAVVYGPPLVSCVSQGGLTKARYFTQGAVVGSETGAWMAIEGGPVTVQTAVEAPGGVTLFPFTTEGTTVSSDTLSYSVETTTSSAVVSVFGESWTAVQGAAGLHHGGGPLVKGQTFTQVASPGGYKDAVSGTVTSFSGEGSIWTESQSNQIRSWYPIAAISPPELREDRRSIVFAAPKNNSQIPSA
jgi:hypothetical protein